MRETEHAPVYLPGMGDSKMRVGLLSRESPLHIRFEFDRDYIGMGPTRPILSLAWHTPNDEEKTKARLTFRDDKESRQGLLPVWFANLLPEGALRTLVESQLPAGRVDEFDVLTALGHDLPGAVYVDTKVRKQAMPMNPPAAAQTIPRLRFSLAGVQMKFSSVRNNQRLTLPAVGETGNVIAKLPSDTYPDLPEIEFTAMSLADAAGVHTAPFDLLPGDQAPDIPAALRPGPSILAVQRFDRGAEGERIHMEDFGQILGARGDQKYSKGNEESVLNIIHRFSHKGMVDVEEGVRRMVVNLLLGNTDAHLKNWSFLFPGGNGIELSPAYDIVSTFLYETHISMALGIRGKRDPYRIEMKQFIDSGGWVGMTEKRTEKLVRRVIEQAAETWPKALKNLPVSKSVSARFDRHWRDLPVTDSIASPF